MDYESCHPEPLSSTPQSNSSFVGIPVWAKDLPRCIGRNCYRLDFFTKNSSLLAKKPRKKQISLDTSREGPSPKGRGSG